MLHSRIKAQAAKGLRAIACIAEIQASIASLNDDDLLDLAHIFAGAAQTPLKTIAATEMLKRSLSM